MFRLLVLLLFSTLIFFSNPLPSFSQKSDFIEDEVLIKFKDYEEKNLVLFPNQRERKKCYSKIR
ncbi:MAG: hypothetical protein ACP5IN_00005, partial [Caldimicrobium sp.]